MSDAINGPITVWIVDDDNADSHDAARVIERVARQYCDEYRIDSVVARARDFEWPPFNSMEPVLNLTPFDMSRWTPPDIVVLDLVDARKIGEPNEGIQFYRALRDWERENRFKASFVILWSFYSGGKGAELFAKNTIDADRRFDALNSKQPPVLETSISGYYKRVIEERENL
jgi:hypothetical protein